jgi:aquaporin related protein
MVAMSFGAALCVSVWCFFRVSGGLFNPAVTWAFMLIGAMTPLRGVILFATQIMGGMTGAALARTLTPGKLHAATVLHEGVNHARGLFIEFFMTAVLVFSILMMAVEKNRSTPIAPIGIGLTLFICELFSVYWTGGSLNPARSFGPCVVNHSFPGYHWIYWIGPLCGSLLAVVIYWILKALRYEEVGGAVDQLTFPGPDHSTRAQLERQHTQLLHPSHTHEHI